MSTIKSSDEHLTLNADGSSKDIKFQANGVEKASISSSGAFTSTTIDATKLTGTIPNFTSTGIDDNADATAITIDSSENVEIASTVNPRGVKLYTKGSADLMDGYLVFSKPDSGTYNWRVLPNNIATGDLTFQVTTDTNTNEATQASTFSTKLQLTRDGRGLSQFTAKAWINFNGTGTASIRDSHNVSHITDDGTGRYFVSFSNAMSNANYAVAGAGRLNQGTVSLITSNQTSGFNCYSYHSHNSTYEDNNAMQLIVFGD